MEGLVFEDGVRLSAFAMGSDSVVAFVSKVLLLDGVSDETLTGPAMTKLLNERGVLWKGKPLARDLIYALMGLAPFIKHGPCHKALLRLDSAAPTLLQDATKIMRLCQLIKKSSTVEDRVKVFCFFIKIFDTLRIFKCS